MCYRLVSCFFVYLVFFETERMKKKKWDVLPTRLLFFCLSRFFLNRTYEKKEMGCVTDWSPPPGRPSPDAQAPSRALVALTRRLAPRPPAQKARREPYIQKRENWGSCVCVRKRDVRIYMMGAPSTDPICFNMENKTDKLESIEISNRISHYKAVILKFNQSKTFSKPSYP